MIGKIKTVPSVPESILTIKSLLDDQSNSTSFEFEIRLLNFDSSDRLGDTNVRNKRIQSNKKCSRKRR